LKLGGTLFSANAFVARSDVKAEIIRSITAALASLSLDFRCLVFSNEKRFA